MTNELIKIFSTSDEVEAQLIINLLEENDIHCLKKEPGSGEYINIYLGTSSFEKEIYVNEKNASKAMELINDIKTIQDDSYDEEELKDMKRRNKTKHIMAGIALFIFGAPLLFGIIFSIISSLLK